MIYEPQEDSFLLAAEVKKYAQGKSVLDMGSGSGIQALTAIRAGACTVLAVDNDTHAIRHLNSLGVPTLRSNIFKKVSGTLDLIICNPPYLPEDTREDTESALATTGGTKGDEFILEFLRQAKKHLEKRGVILVVLSSLTPRKRISALLKKLHFKKELLASQAVFMETLEVWKIKKSESQKY